jgi:hypothetical protein
MKKLRMILKSFFGKIVFKRLKRNTGREAINNPDNKINR